MTSVEPDEIHDDIDPDATLDLTGDELVDEWRGVNVEDVEEVTGGLAGLLRSRSRALLADLIRPHHRALIASSVLVLDDPLSALDVHTEALVQDALRPMIGGCTVFVVVHRPSTVALADRSILLDGGRLVAVGTHHDLLEREPRYRAVLSEDAEDLAAETGSSGIVEVA